MSNVMPGPLKRWSRGRYELYCFTEGGSLWWGAEVAGYGSNGRTPWTAMWRAWRFQKSGAQRGLQ